MDRRRRNAAVSKNACSLIRRRQNGERAAIFAPSAFVVAGHRFHARLGQCFGQAREKHGFPRTRFTNYRQDPLPDFTPRQGHAFLDIHTRRPQHFGNAVEGFSLIFGKRG